MASRRGAAVCFFTGVGIPLGAGSTLLESAGRERPARILNIGIAGAYPGSGLSIGDIVMGTSEVYGDIGFELPESPGFQHVREAPGGSFYREPLPLAAFPEFSGTATGRGCTVNACTGTDATGRLRELCLTPPLRRWKARQSRRPGRCSASPSARYAPSATSPPSAICGPKTSNWP